MSTIADRKEAKTVLKELREQIEYAEKRGLWGDVACFRRAAKLIRRLTVKRKHAHALDYHPQDPHDKPSPKKARR
jgi:hypothetical protein